MTGADPHRPGESGGSGLGTTGFRGTTIGNIRQFPVWFTEPAKVIRLTRSYRSTQLILNAANAVLAHADERSRAKRLRAKRSGNKRPRLLLTCDERDQARVIAFEIAALKAAGKPLSSMVVLARQTSNFNFLEIELNKNDVPYVKNRGLHIADRKVVRDLLAILWFVDRPDLDLAANRALQLVSGIGKASAQLLFKKIGGKRGPSHLRSLTVSRMDEKAWRKFATMIGRISKPAFAWNRKFNRVRAWYEQSRNLSSEDRCCLEQLSVVAQGVKSRRALVESLASGQALSTSNRATKFNCRRSMALKVESGVTCGL
jgi:DNA helicase-2/ATP-dependent DNA helicase PcrA